MASTRCLATLSSAGDFKALDVDAQAVRLVQFLSDEWFGPEPIDVINNIRFSQRIRVHASQVGMSVGDLMIGLLQEAREVHAQQTAGEETQPASGRLIDAPSIDTSIEDIPVEMVADVPAEDVPAEAVSTPPPSAPEPPKRRAGRAK